MAEAARIPLTVIGGFLGAGKTTLVNRILGGLDGVRAAVLVNDFGAVNVDAALVAEHRGETIALTNGCVCCSIGGDLTDALIRVMSRAPAPEWIVIEASGLSDPWRIAEVGLADPGLALDGVVVLVDAASVRALAEDPLLRDTLLRQLPSADVLVANKCDLVAAAELPALRRWLAQFAPGTPVLEAIDADVPHEALTGHALARLHAGDVRPMEHAARFETALLECPGISSASRLRALLGRMPPGVLRAKGVLATDEMRAAVFQYSGRHGSLRPLEGAPPPVEGHVVAIGLRGELPVEALRRELSGASLAPPPGRGYAAPLTPTASSRRQNMARDAFTQDPNRGPVEEQGPTTAGVDRRDFIKAGAALGLAAGAGQLGIAQAQSGPKQGGTLVMVVQPEPPTLASYANTSGPIGQVAPKVYDGLLEYDFKMNALPGLAKSWTLSPDGKTVTFKLQEGVKFHDGKPFSSADVQYTVMEVLKKIHPRGPTNFQEVESIDTPDPLTAIFHLKNPAPYMLKALSAYESPMLPRHLFEGTDIKNNPQANKPVGTGPFKFVEWQRGQFIRLDRNPDYWRKGKPYLDRIVARFIGEAQTRTAAVEKGEVTYAAYGAVPNIDSRRLTKESRAVTVTTRGYEMDAPILELEFNTTRKPFDNQKVRQAVAHAIDRKFVIENIWFGYGKVATGPISSALAPTGIYTEDVKKYDVPNRMEIANKLLDEAGYPKKDGGIRFEITHDITPYGEEWRRFGEYVQQVLGQLGIKVTLRYEDVATWIRRIYTNYDYDLSSDWLKTFGDPVIGVQRQYWSKSIRPGVPWVNGTRWTDPKVDSLIEAAAIEADPRKRAALYHEFQKLVVEACPIVWVAEMQFTTVHNNSFEGLVVSPLGVNTSFDGAWKKA